MPNVIIGRRVVVDDGVGRRPINGNPLRVNIVYGLSIVASVVAAKKQCAFVQWMNTLRLSRAQMT